MSTEFHWIAVAVVVTIASARMTRLATYDKFPPVVWLRDKFLDFTENHPRLLPWQLLALCGYCASFWITLIIVLLTVASGWVSLPADWPWYRDVWVVLISTLAASYLAAVFMKHDGDV